MLLLWGLQTFSQSTTLKRHFSEIKTATSTAAIYMQAPKIFVSGSTVQGRNADTSHTNSTKQSLKG
jgi:hypothetical protein